MVNMNNGAPLTESDFQRIVIEHLVEDNNYVERCSKTDFDPLLAMDTDLLFEFLERTQHESMEHLRRVFDEGWKVSVLKRINEDICKRGLITALWEGVDFDAETTVDLVYPRPSAKFDKRAADEYAANALSVMEEVYHKPDERVDLVIFLNGIALFTIELKCPTSGTKWTYEDAIRQYCEERDWNSRLLKHRVGALANFAMDLSQVWVCAELKGKESTFLPFNRGVKKPGSNHETLPGNPHNPNGIDTSYMWEDILTKDTVFDLLYDFVYERRDKDKNGKVIGRHMIFPRYQQLRAVRRVAKDIAVADAKGLKLRNYLVEHSAGSGKTNTISWLAHMLSSMYSKGSSDLLFEKVLIITDRKVVDFQLQAAVNDMAKDTGVVRVMDKDSHSSDLERALTQSYRIIVTTTQKFLHLKNYGTFKGTDKRFAVLIDEAHGSTSGKSMTALSEAIGSGREEPEATIDELDRAIKNQIGMEGKQANVSIIGFTATPKGKTLQNFGSLNADGKHEAFDLYSMRQAIAEGFILDVTSNYTTYETYCKVVKTVAEDPELETLSARRQLMHLVACDPTSIQGKLEIMIDHYLSTVAPTLGGKAKGMIVARGREEAVRYFLAFQAYQKAHRDKLGHLLAYVAFTDEVDVGGQKYTEAGLNGISEDKLPEYLKKDDWSLLFVADKYQTGFDQPYLASMYVDKPLRGVICVQTLSRLNRMCKPYDKRVFVLDFVNGFEDIMSSFSDFYETTVLTEPMTLADVRHTEERLLAFNVLDEGDVREYNEILAKNRHTIRQKERMFALVCGAADRVKAMSDEVADEVRRTIRNFIRQYSFMLQAVAFEDVRLHMEYNFCLHLINAIESGGGGGLDISDKVRIEEFSVRKSGTYENSPIVENQEVSIAMGTGTGYAHDELELLSRIIDDWNMRYSIHGNKHQLKGIVDALEGSLADDARVRRSAEANGLGDFKTTLNDRTVDTLAENYDGTNELYNVLLSHEDARRELVDIIAEGIYRGLRQGD